jgi:hypothetical protein
MNNLLIYIEGEQGVQIPPFQSRCSPSLNLQEITGTLLSRSEGVQILGRRAALRGLKNGHNH